MLKPSSTTVGRPRGNIGFRDSHLLIMIEINLEFRHQHQAFPPPTPKRRPVFPEDGSFLGSGTASFVRGYGGDARRSDMPPRGGDGDGWMMGKWPVKMNRMGSEGSRWVQ